MVRAAKRTFFLVILVSIIAANHVDAKATSQEWHADGKEVVVEWHADNPYFDNTPFQFPDERTEQLIRSIMGMQIWGVDESHEITNRDLYNVRGFYLNDKTLSETMEYISVLKYFPQLTTVEIRNCGLKEIPEELSKLPIDTLRLEGDDVRDISALANMKSLHILSLSGNNFIVDYSSLQGLENLISLNISLFSCSDITPITHCKGLKTLCLSGTFERVMDGCWYSPGRYCVPFLDASFIDDLPSLEHLTIAGFSEISDEAFEQIENSNTEAEIEVFINDEEVRDLYSDLVNGINDDWIGEGALFGLPKEDVLEFYEQRKSGK